MNSSREHYQQIRDLTFENGGMDDLPRKSPRGALKFYRRKKGFDCACAVSIRRSWQNLARVTVAAPINAAYRDVAQRGFTQEQLVR